MVNATSENVVKVFREATPEQLAEGTEWYREAHEFSRYLSEAYGVTLETAAGIIAALSPMMSWGHNKVLAERLLEQGGLTAGCLVTSRTKANAILGGMPPEEAFAGRTSQKTAAFYHGILTCGQTDAVCVDRHAFDLATATRHTDSTRPNLAGKRYGEVAEAYREAAALLRAEFGVTPAQVQAVTWVVWRQKFWAKGAFDGRAA